MSVRTTEDRGKNRGAVARCSTHGVLVLGHDADQRAASFRVLAQQIEADLLDAASVRQVVQVRGGRGCRARWATAAQRRVKLTANNNKQQAARVMLASGRITAACVGQVVGSGVEWGAGLAA